MTIYLVAGKEVDSEDDDFQNYLASVHNQANRPLCLCKEGGIEMYVTKINNHYTIKRMPNSGGVHAVGCSSYEMPGELTGLGEVMGAAINENLEEGTTDLKLDFSLSKGKKGKTPAISESESDSVKTDGTKLTIRSTLHYLWEQAGFNRWHPRMEGKRNWYIVRKHLLSGCETSTAKKSSLPDILYIPESFNLDQKAEIQHRRMAKFTPLMTANPNGSQKMMIVVGEVKMIDKARFGQKIVFKHLPDCHFMMNDDLHKRLMKRFDAEFKLWEALEDTHMIAIGTFGVNQAGFATLDELALMVVDANWIPIENQYEKEVIDEMVRQKRVFIKGLRYNLSQKRPLASLVTADIEPIPTAMYVIPPGASEEYIQDVDAMIEDSTFNSWVWNAAELMPEFPVTPKQIGYTAHDAVDLTSRDSIAEAMPLHASQTQ